MNRNALDQKRLREISDQFEKVANRIGKAPGFPAWSRLRELIEAARGDPTIAAHRPCVEFLGVLNQLVGDAVFARNGDEAFAPLIEVLEKMRQANIRKGVGAATRDKVYLAARKLLGEAAAKYRHTNGRPIVARLARDIQLAKKDRCNEECVKRHLRALVAEGRFSG